VEAERRGVFSIVVRCDDGLFSESVLEHIALDMIIAWKALTAAQ
jgi:hypothetical protein